MKLDQDLFRQILIRIEELPTSEMTYYENFREIILSDYPEIDENIIKEHLVLISEAGFIKCGIDRLNDGEVIIGVITRLTYDGHIFLSKIRDNSRWEKVKSIIKKSGTRITVNALDSINSSLIEKILLE